MSFRPEFETTKQEDITTKKRETNAANPKEEKSCALRLLLFLEILRMPKESIVSRKNLILSILFRVRVTCRGQRINWSRSGFATIRCCRNSAPISYAYLDFFAFAKWN